MSETLDATRLWSRFLLKLKVHNPFFSTLAMFATFKAEKNVAISLTQDKALLIAPNFLAEMSEPQQFSYLLHQVLHLALQHIKRGEGRQVQLWNIAADITVNQIISDTTDWPIAPNTAWDGRFRGLSVERVYAALQKEVQKNCTQPVPSFNSSDGVDSNGSKSDTQDTGQPGEEKLSTEQDNDSLEDELSPSTFATPSQSGKHQQHKHVAPSSEHQVINALQNKYQCHQDFRSVPTEQQQRSHTFWRSAMTKATQLHPGRISGNESDSLTREVELGHDNQLDWRLLLWKYATPALVDYREFDNRFIHAGYYTETLHSEKLIVDVVIDTSGSVMEKELSIFIGEMLAIHQCHPHTILRFFYADTELYGPYDMPQKVSQIPKPLGNGGTSFIPYFEKQENETDIMKQPQAAIYFTDGFGAFPKRQPSIPTLWILTEDGCEDNEVPFGTIARIKIC